MIKRKLLTVVMDGIGVRSSSFGNAVSLARTPNMNWLQHHALYSTIKAHGTYVGLPSDQDIGNSEVGHNALGSGQLFDQGAKLVNRSIADGSVYEGKGWQEILSFVSNYQGTLHFIGLLSDGNVHSHQEHLHAMMEQAVKQGMKKIRIHILLDGRDVEAQSAELYIERLNKKMSELNQEAEVDVKVASGGGRMVITMDRYEADWSMVRKGWETHVLGIGAAYDSLDAALTEMRKEHPNSDQDLPAFVIKENGEAVGTINDGDGVIFFNFRGDRSIEISRAFEKVDFSEFDRQRMPNVCYAGMMEYDGDEHIPKRYLVDPPAITNTFGEHLATQGVRQFACSETQKYGHVTFFWNGNRSGYFDKALEHYVEIPSDVIPFHYCPWMKALEITQATLKEMADERFEYGRINFPNGDMVGHTGDFDAAIIGVETVDLMLGHLIRQAQKTNTILLITADHGNADEMFEGKEADYPNWENLEIQDRPKRKTSHTLAQVPLYVYDPTGNSDRKLADPGVGTLSCIANTSLELMGMKARDEYFKSLLIRT